MDAAVPGRTRRVVFIHSSNEMYGADRILLQVVESLRSVPGLIPEVWLPDDVQPESDSLQQELVRRGVATRVIGLPILRRKYLTPRHFPKLAFQALTLWLRLARARPAFVYCATSAVLIAAPVARLAGRRNIILHVQEIWPAGEANTLGRLASFASHAIAISQAAGDALRGPVTGRTHTIMNAVPDHGDPPATRIPIGDAPLEFVMASRWNSWKGHATLLEAWDRLDEPPGRLTILGSAPRAGENADVPGMVARLKHPDSVRIVGQVNAITAFLDVADFVVIPSDDPEPFGLVAIEAFSRFRPVIATSGGGLSEIVTPGLNGHLFANRDSAALARILTSVTRVEARRFGESARTAYVEKHSSARFNAQFERFWAQLETGSIA